MFYEFVNGCHRRFLKCLHSDSDIFSLSKHENQEQIISYDFGKKWLKAI